MILEIKEDEWWQLEVGTDETTIFENLIAAEREGVRSIKQKGLRVFKIKRVSAIRTYRLQ